MKSIINVRRLLDMLRRGRRESDNGRQNQNRGYDVIVGGELFTDYSDHSLQTCHAKPKTQINRRRTLPASFPLVTSTSSLAWKIPLRKSGRWWALQQIKERGALPMIDRGDIRQAIDRCSNIWSVRWAVIMVSST